MIGLPIMYLIIFVENIILLKKAVKSKKNRNWILLLLIEAVMIFVAKDSIDYFDNIPTGGGFMSGLQLFGEVEISKLALFLYCGELIISFFALIIAQAEKDTNNTD